MRPCFLFDQPHLEVGDEMFFGHCFEVRNQILLWELDVRKNYRTA